MASPYQMR